MRPRTIAIDGPAASGKSSLGELLAKRLGYLYFDTGIMYRAVTLETLQRQIPIANEDAVTRLSESLKIDLLPPTVQDGRQFTVTADGRDITWEIRAPIVDANVSPVSTYAGVRAAMTEQQRKIAKRGNIIMAGRDIGTVILPDADLKIYLDAALEERARRRLLERVGRGQVGSFEQILQEIIKRDEIDSTRTVAPLRRSVDAKYLDNTKLTLEETVEHALKLVNGQSL